MMELTIIYCFDAWCGWCFGFSQVIKQLRDEFHHRFYFEVLSGGMILPGKPVHLSATATYLQQTYKNIEAVSGMEFGNEYLWHINNPDLSDWYPNSEKPAIALCIFKELYPGKQVEFAADLQYALHVEGRDLCDDEAYRHLLIKYNLSQKSFYEKLHSELYKEQAYYEFALVKQLKVTGYPCVLMQITDSKFYLLANGYTDYNIVAERIEVILKEIDIPNI